MRDPLWFAQRGGQDWRDGNVLRVIEWFTSCVDSRAWSRRMDEISCGFEAAQQALANGEKNVALFDPNDAIAWYVFQAHAFAAKRENWYEPEAYRIAPVFWRLGQVLPHLQFVAGVYDRIEHLMTEGKSQPDDTLYELLVAASYKSRGWNDVRFVATQPGVTKTHDIVVATSRRRWAVECKRVKKTGYAAEEREQAEKLASTVHELCSVRNRSVVLEVIFKVELWQLGETYLAERVAAFFENRSHNRWEDLYALGRIREIDWAVPSAVLQADDVFYGSSRMVELLAGEYIPHVDYSLSADWVPAADRPLFATSIRQASVIAWKSGAPEAAFRKARHFRSLVAKACRQLPEDAPGVIHIGYENRIGDSTDELLHLLNLTAVKDFSPHPKRLRWVYANYMAPEHTTNRNESLAVTETTARYKIGRHQTAEPLANHLLFSDEEGVQGCHW